MKFFLFVSSLFFLASCAKRPSSQNYFPEIGKNALHQRAVDLRGNLKILSIALRPGYEDLATLAYFRLGRGAVVMSLYVTNGEAGESDVQGEYPPYLAAIRREEAVRAMAYLGSDARFLNMPDLIAGRDSAYVRRLWPGDSLQAKLGMFVSQFKPDLILLSRDWGTDTGRSPWWEILRADLLETVQNAAAATPVDLAVVANVSQAWTVSRVAIDDGSGQGQIVPVSERHPRWKKSYAEIGAEAGQAYASLAVQRRSWQQQQTPAYKLSYPIPARVVKQLDDGLPEAVPSPLRGIEIQIEHLTTKALENGANEALPRIAALIDSVQYALARQSELTVRGRKILLQWKNGLENLRCTLLGVEVDYTISDTVLTDHQLTYLTINEAKGMSADGKTEILFAGLDQSWAVNEDFPKRLPLKLKEGIRLLSPGGLVFNFPPAQYTFQVSPFAKSFYFFIIHQAPGGEKNFLHRSTVNLQFAPKFVAEVLTPVVRMAPEERIVVRLMNISRDGIRDTVEVADSLATSFRHPFRVSTKGASVVDTLQLAWRGNPPDGTYLIPVEIDSVKVAQFAARKFRAEVNASKRIGLLTGIKNSPTAETLRRLNVKFSAPASKSALVQQMAALDVLIIDYRALTLQPQFAEWRDEFDHFVEQGGHLIILAQDAAVWNAQPLWKEMRLTRAQLFDPEIPLHAEAGHAVLASPNPIASTDWQDWLFARAYNIVTLPATNGTEIPLRAAPGGEPLLVTTKKGQGRTTYVDLALSPQLMNVHAGAFRLLANLISL
ncbi:MAG: PIG-L family deacetylase [bacterium]